MSRGPASPTRRQAQLGPHDDDDDDDDDGDDAFIHTYETTTTNTTTRNAQETHASCTEAFFVARLPAFSAAMREVGVGGLTYYHEGGGEG